MAAQLFSAIFVIVIGVGGLVADFCGDNKLVALLFRSRGCGGDSRFDLMRRWGAVRPGRVIGQG